MYLRWFKVRDRQHLVHRHQLPEARRLRGVQVPTATGRDQQEGQTQPGLLRCSAIPQSA